MSVVAMAWAWEQDLEPAQKIILLAISDVANDDGIAYPTNLDLAFRCNMSERSVITHVHELVHKNLLIQEHRDGKPSVFMVPIKSPMKNLQPFEQFWNVYPKKVGKKPCASKWKSLRLDALANRIIQDVQNRLQNDSGWQRGYAPNPLTYLNQARWEDEIQQVVTKDAGSIARKWREQRERIIDGDVLDGTKMLTH